jgi:hypothetical protein
MITNSDNMDKIQSIVIVDSRININTNSNDGISGAYTVKLSTVPSIESSILVYDLLSLISSIDNASQFERTDGSFFDKISDNIVIRCENIDTSIKILQNVKQYNNLILRKILYTKTDNSVHLYITALRS